MISDQLPSIVPIEDFWSRQANTQQWSFDFAPFGIPAKITANEPEVLAAARLASGRYSQAPEPNGQAMLIQLVVGRGSGGHLPHPPNARKGLDDVLERLAHAGVGEWLTVSAGEWGHGFANLHTRTACIFLSPTLAGATRLISRHFIDHYVTNFIHTEWAMLHASAAADPTGQRLIIMLAPHNTGKSTTALRLVRAGYNFLADGEVMLRLDDRSQRLVVGGYPIGEVKLRDDVLRFFPEYSGEVVRVREQRKTVINLRTAHPGHVAEELLTPASIQLCCVERGHTARTQVTPLTVANTLPILAANTVYWNESARLEHNTAALHTLLRQASLFCLKIGTDTDDLVTTINKLG